MGEATNRWLWFFRMEESGRVRNGCAAYETADPSEACAWYESEYGGHVLEARRRELTFHEYCGMLLCNRDGSEHPKKVYEAMQDLFFRVDPRIE